MNTKTITRTAVLLALLVSLQYATKPLGSQLLTGSCVNLILAASVGLCGLQSAAVVALASPVFAYLFGISPQLFLTPAIMAGNFVFVLLLALLGKNGKDTSRSILAVVAAAAAKFAVLWILVVQLLIPVGKLPAPVAVQFSWPQLVTALIGGGLSIVLVPVLRKALKESESVPA